LDGLAAAFNNKAHSVRIAHASARFQSIPDVRFKGITVVQNRGRGPMIVQVRDCRVALGRGEARKVLVQQEAADHEPVDQ